MVRPDCHPFIHASGPCKNNGGTSRYVPHYVKDITSDEIRSCKTSHQDIERPKKWNISTGPLAHLRSKEKQQGWIKSLKRREKPDAACAPGMDRQHLEKAI